MDIVQYEEYNLLSSAVAHLPDNLTGIVVMKIFAVLFDVTLHCEMLRYNVKCYATCMLLDVTLHCEMLHYIVRHYTTLLDIMLHVRTQWEMLRYVEINNITLQFGLYRISDVSWQLLHGIVHVKCQAPISLCLTLCQVLYLWKNYFQA